MRLLSLGTDMRRREFLGVLGGAAAVVAARRARAAAERCGGSASLWRGRGRRERRPAWRHSEGLAAIGLDRGPQCADRHPLGDGRCRRFANTRPNWSRLRRMSSWPVGASTVGHCCRRPALCRSCSRCRRPGRRRFRRELARPGGNATGFTQFEYGFSGKWLELLKQIAPG